MYQSIDKETSKTKGVALAAGAASLLFGSAYFLYSGVYGTQTPLHSFFTNETPEAIRIEYYMDDMPEGLKPNTLEWTAYHDELMTAAGYDAQALRSNPNADVSFIAYDEYEEEEDSELSADYSANQPMRKSYGITCYTMYSEVGDVNNQKCEATKKIKNPIRTGCSSLGSGTDIFGTYPFKDLECKSDSEHEKVSARCCQPSPKTMYKKSSYKVSIKSSTEEKCTSVTCSDDEIMVGCQGSTKQSGLSGAQTVSNSECKVHSSMADGKVTADALCAAQPKKGDFELRCFAYNSDSSEEAADGFISSMQCPPGKVMFDCTAFVISNDECDADDLLLDADYHHGGDGADDSADDDGVLNGEYYFKETKKSKVLCEGVGDSQKVRVQATCCHFLEKKGPDSYSQDDDEE